MPAAATKTCVVCHADISTQKRVKDAHGRYYCHSCWAAQSPPTASSDYGCSICRQLFSAEQVYDDNGAFICHGCFARRASSVAETSPVDDLSALASAAPPQRAPFRSTPSRPKTARSGSGADAKLLKKILIVCGVVLLLAFCVPVVVVMLGGSEDQSSQSTQDWIAKQRAEDEARSKMMDAALDKAQKDADASFAENRRMERDNAEWLRNHQSDTDPDVRKAWPDHPFSSDANAQKVYDRIKRMHGE